MIKDVDFKKHFYQFPSPIGELHFSIVTYNDLNSTDKIVSVPYRGATFLNYNAAVQAAAMANVSVPYRGATFLNDEKCLIDGKDENGFPSPIGELHFSMCFQFIRPTQIVVSVPYRGATFLNHP